MRAHLIRVYQRPSAAINPLHLQPGLFEVEPKAKLLPALFSFSHSCFHNFVHPDFSSHHPNNSPKQTEPIALSLTAQLIPRLSFPALRSVFVAKSGKNSMQSLHILNYFAQLTHYRCVTSALSSFPLRPAAQITLVTFNQKRMQGNHHQPRKLSAFDKLILACDRATFFLTPNRQAYVQFNGTVAPLYSEQFRGWLLTRIEALGLDWPSSSTLGRLLRHHDNILHTYESQIIPVHTRIAAENHTLLVDLQSIDPQTSDNQVIEITKDHWRITSSHPTLFRRPELNLPIPTPAITKGTIVQYLMGAFSTTQPIAETLSNWLALSMIPTATQPILVITGNARIEAARLLRNIIDPVIHPLLPMPTTENQLGQMAQTNSVLTFDSSPFISEKRKAALSRIRRGVPVRVREINKSRTLYETIHRPILIAADAPIEIESNQINIEINHCRQAPLNEFLTALLNHVVEVLRYLEAPKQTWESESFAIPAIEAPTAQPTKPFT